MMGTSRPQNFVVHRRGAVVVTIVYLPMNACMWLFSKSTMTSQSLSTISLLSFSCSLHGLVSRCVTSRRLAFLFVFIFSGINDCGGFEQRPFSKISCPEWVIMTERGEVTRCSTLSIFEPQSDMLAVYITRG